MPRPADSEWSHHSRAHPATLTVAEANQVFYSEYAERYEEVEQCVFGNAEQDLLRKVLGKALATLPGQPANVLDACGGTGNVSLTLLRDFGVPRTTVVDISPEMLNKCRRHAYELGAEIETVNSEITAFFDSDQGEWDLIVFSSALHHLEDYAQAFTEAWNKLAVGGVLVSLFDPVVMGRPGQWIRRLDWLGGLMVHSGSEFVRTVRNRLTRTGSDSDEYVGRIAERYALAGVDDFRLRELLVENGAEIVDHSRYPQFRLSVTRALARLFRQSSAFHMIVRRPK